MKPLCSRTTETGKWMIRNDGKDIKVMTFPKGVKNNLLVNAGVAAFLYRYDNRKCVIEFLNWFFADLLVNKSRQLLQLSGPDLEEELRNLLAQLPDVCPFAEGGVEDKVNLLYAARRPSLFTTGTQAFDYAEAIDDAKGNDFCIELNQVFCKAWINDTDATFFISSRYFDWTDNIKKFVRKHYDEIKSVSVVRSLSADLAEGYCPENQTERVLIYPNTEGRPIYRVPIDEFLRYDYAISCSFYKTGSTYWNTALASGVNPLALLSRQPAGVQKDTERAIFTACLTDEYRSLIPRAALHA